MKIPYLEVSPRLRLVMVTLMYIAQGVQFGLMTVAIPSYLAAQDMASTVVGSFIAAIMLPWSLKLVVAPLMDKYSYVPMGRKRPWIMGSMAAASAGYLLMGMMEDPIAQFGLFTLLAACVSAFVAVMDVAIDGQAIELIPDEEQSTANAFMWGGKVLGMSGTIAFSAWSLEVFGLSTTSFFAALVSILFLIFPVLFREREGDVFFLPKGVLQSDHIASDPTNNAIAMKGIINILLYPSSIFLAIGGFLHGMTYGIFDALMPVHAVRDLGLDDRYFSNTASVAGLFSGILALVIGGLLIKKLGRRRALAFFLAMLSVLILAYFSSTLIWGYKEHIFALLVFTVYLFRTLILISFFALAMWLCEKKMAATQFAIYMALGNLGISAGAAFAGYVSIHLETLLVFPFIIIFSLVAIVCFIQVKGRRKEDGSVELLYLGKE